MTHTYCSSKSHLALLDGFDGEHFPSSFPNANGVKNEHIAQHGTGGTWACVYSTGSVVGGLHVPLSLRCSLAAK